MPVKKALGPLRSAKDPSLEQLEGLSVAIHKWIIFHEPLEPVFEKPWITMNTYENGWRKKEVTQPHLAKLIWERLLMMQTIFNLGSRYFSRYLSSAPPVRLPHMVMEPKAKSKANFCGAMTMTGKKEKDSAAALGFEMRCNLWVVCKKKLVAVIHLVGSNYWSI